MAEQPEAGTDDVTEELGPGVPQYGPAIITVEFWMDKEPEVHSEGLADWVVRDVLRRASYRVNPDLIPVEDDEDAYEEDEGEAS